VEHFDRTKKGSDDYFNYYAVLQNANLRKTGKEKKYAGAPFFTSLFFQNREELERRIHYVPGEELDGIYEEAIDGDREAEAFIDYLGFNDSCLREDRRRHIKRLRDFFEIRRGTTDDTLEWFRNHPEELSFITAIEAEFGLNLSEVLEALTE